MSLQPIPPFITTTTNAVGSIQCPVENEECFGEVAFTFECTLCLCCNAAPAMGLQEILLDYLTHRSRTACSPYLTATASSSPASPLPCPCHSYPQLRPPPPHPNLIPLSTAPVPSTHYSTPRPPPPHTHTPSPRTPPPEERQPLVLKV